MRLFYHRPLVAACALFIISLLAVFFLPLRVSFVLLAICAASLLALLVWCVLGGFSYRRICLMLSLLALALGGVRMLYDQQTSEDVWAKEYTQTAQVEFSVKEILYANTYGGELLVDVHAVNGEQVNSRAVIRAEVQLPFYVGDRIRATVTVQPLDYEAYAADSEYRYYADGAKALFVLDEESVPLLISDGNGKLKTRLLDLRAVLSRRISKAVGGEEGRLLAAMLLGSKHLLSEQTVRDFRLSGVSHLLALSGLHLMILAGLFERFLYLLGAGKRLRIAILLPLCIFYLMLTGCNYSLLRAMIMLGFVYLSALLREDQDSLTSLLLVGCIILLFTPYAIFSLSFQMTMLATFGILAFARIQAFLGEVLPKGKGKMRLGLSLVRFVCSSLLISISTTVALLPVLWLTVGTFSLMTPLANLVLVPLAPLLLLAAILVLPLPFVGVFAGAPAALMLALTKLFGSAQAVISLQAPYVAFVVILISVATLVLLVIDLKRFYPLALLPGMACMLCFVMIFFVFAGMDQDLSVLYRHSGKNEGLILVRGNEAMICDLSATSLTQLRADWLEAQGEGATELSVLLLTHYHSKSVTAVSRFTQGVILRELWLPAPVDEAEEELCAELIAVAISRDVRVTIYETQTLFTVFDTGILTISKQAYSARSTELAFSMSLRYGEAVICYHTASLYEYYDAQGIAHTCAPTHLILGAHGPVPKKTLPASFEGAQSVLIGSEAYFAILEIDRKTHYVLPQDRYRYELE